MKAFVHSAGQPDDAEMVQALDKVLICSSAMHPIPKDVDELDLSGEKGCKGAWQC